MSHNKRHIRTLPNGTLAISTFTCDDDAANEVDICHKTQFELGREFLKEPSGPDAFRTIIELGDDWRSLVHFTDWIRWDEPLPLKACHCVDVKDLPSDRSTRDNWKLEGRKVIVKIPG